ncbi:Peter Pan-like protein [Galdieria sulphuraria]|uniref:Brix domain-containing protein n=1 Tax=Galdieria sulphuraria TaxID=130081 RepID=M2Y552_GALSU|nr:uncharacterized protein Gasu_17460 [Galdieria sulphuraria]EME30984.1 hypothetical protein Gasu_17460 [Galdieria sulphuraria]GJD10945.1 Peter Pan-like protein [Galdieria sulphuraria]|eukprot:XP_005707504.1 hypothetical protein Gasu_17460 [Galdieria sulphuraria]
MPRHRKKRRTHVPVSEEENKVPITMVCKKGKITNSLADLVMDLRNMLRPHTTRKMQESASSSLNEFATLAKKLGVSHLWILSESVSSTTLRIGRLPKGPTFTFRVNWFSLAADVRKAQKRPHIVSDAELKDPPLLVLHGFEDSRVQERMMSSLFQFMFPAIDLDTLKPQAVKRVLLVNYDREKEVIEIRHYLIRTNPVGLSRPIRKLLYRKIPKQLNTLTDISELLDRGGDGAYSSESEGEGSEDNRCSLVTENNNNTSKRASVILYEVGPRMSLQLWQIQEELFSGSFVYESKSS